MRLTKLAGILAAVVRFERSGSGASGGAGAGRKALFVDTARIPASFVRRMNRPTVDGMCLKARAFVRNRQTIPRMLRSERDYIAVRLT